MSSLVYFQILRASKHFTAAHERACERLLASMNTNVVDQLVLGLERLPLSNTILPKANMNILVGPTDMVDGQMRHDLVHPVKHSIAHFLRVRIDPAAYVLGFSRGRWAHIP